MQVKLQILKDLNEDISEKTQRMQIYDNFLTRVIETNSDEFEGPENVVAWYKTLKESNERLKKSAHHQEHDLI